MTIIGDLPKQNAETYLGDGLYVSFDGFYLRLRAPRENGQDHWIGFEGENFQALLRWIESYSTLKQYFLDPERKEK